MEDGWSVGGSKWRDCWVVNGWDWGLNVLRKETFRYRSIGSYYGTLGDSSGEKLQGADWRRGPCSLRGKYRYGRTRRTLSMCYTSPPRLRCSEGIQVTKPALKYEVQHSSQRKVR